MSTRPDKNYLSHAHLRGKPNEPLVLHLGVVRPPDGTYADALKLSDCEHVRVYADEIHGGYEDCLDVNNRCHDVHVYAERWYPRGRYVATVKGESSDISLGGEIIGEGRETDVDLGNWSDQAGGRTRNVTLGLFRASAPVRVRVFHAWNPRFSNRAECYEVNRLGRGWFYHIWTFFKLFR